MKQRTRTAPSRRAPARWALLGALALLPLAACGEFPLKPDHQEQPEPQAESSYRLEPECPPFGYNRPVTLQQVNRIGDTANFEGFKAADIGASARLGDGRLAWVFGDTVRSGSMSPRIVANSMLVTSGPCVSQLIAPDEGPIVKDVREGVVRWPMSIVRLPPAPQFAELYSDVLVVMMSRIDRGVGDTFDFKFLGTDAAIFGVPKGSQTAPQFLHIQELTPDNDDPHQVNWGAASMVDGNWFYVYGTRQTGEDLVFGRELYAGRAPVADPQSRDKWQFWDGDQWQSDMKRATAILPAEDGVSQVLSVDPTGDGFVAVSKRGGDVANFVYTWTAPTPVGPWTSRQSIPAPAGFDTGDLKYAPLAHPEVPLKSGKLLVSISRNSTDFERLLDNPDVGRPEFAEVTIPE